MGNLHNRDDAIARLDELRERHTAARATEHEIRDEIKETLHEAGQLRVDGEPINRSTLIEHSGLSRRTAYEALEHYDE